MKHRIRAAALIEHEGALLLVEHQDHKGDRWWIPPGGGLEDVDATILDCVEREVLEETGLSVEVGALKHMREFIDTTNDTRHFELFYRCALKKTQGLNAHAAAPTLYDHMIVGVKWIPIAALEGFNVFPAELKKRYWEKENIEDGAPAYLGVSVESGDRKS